MKPASVPPRGSRNVEDDHVSSKTAFAGAIENNVGTTGQRKKEIMDGEAIRFDSDKLRAFGEVTMSRGSMANHFITQCGPCPDGTYQPRVSVLLRPVVGRVMATIKDSRRIEGNAALTWMEQRRGDTPRRRCTVHTYSHKHQGLCKYLKCRNLRECL